MSSVRKVVIVGGGTAGITVAARLRKKAGKQVQITLLEPSDKHYYQPLWTLVGAGIFPREKSQRNEGDYIPRGVRWLRDRVSSFHPDQQFVMTAGGQQVDYDFLVVCPGIQLNWNAIEGLSQEIVGKHGICSNYSYQTVASTWQQLKNFQGGTALFTHPLGAVKCGGGPVKICLLAEDHFRRRGIRDRCQVIFGVAMPRIFAVDRYARTLEQITQRRDIQVNLNQDLVGLKPESKLAIFQDIQTGVRSTIPYDMIHVTPKMGPPDFIKSSPLADEAGWIEVDPQTTQHRRYPNIFGLGDASNLPTSKTGAAIRKQAPVTVGNLLALMQGSSSRSHYDGYTSCPLVTGYSGLVLAEFDYQKSPQETFPFDQSKERRSMFWLKKYGLPFLYWHGMLRGRA
jgi:sulfide:quinone oxidoreductase